MIRIPKTAYVAAAVLLMMLSLPALSWPVYCGWLPIIPVAVCWWVARMRTTVTADHLQIRTLTNSSTIEWNQIKGVYFPKPRLLGNSWARAALASGEQVALPAVNWQQIPLLAKASGGRFPDVTALAREAKAKAAAQASAPDEPTDAGE